MATTTFTGEHAYWIDQSVMPVVWKKYYGRTGVLFFIRHTMSVFDVYEAPEIQKRGIRWASESKYHTKENWKQPVYD